jgi:opacity protein-like surface antigen
LNERFFLRYNADIGGFGVRSDLVWQAFLGIGYEITDHTSVAVGYRALGVDYTSSSYKTLDVINHGPLIGIEFRF